MRIYGSSGELFKGSLLTICSPRVRAYSREGGFFEGEGASIRVFTVHIKRNVSFLCLDRQYCKETAGLNLGPLLRSLESM